MTDTNPEHDGQVQTGEPFVVIKGLWLVEFHELHESLPPGAIRKQSRAADDGRTYGDLGTIVAVLTLTSAALQTFTAWLQARQAKHLGRTEPQPEPSGQGYTLELRSDGTVVITLPRLGRTDGERSGDPALSIDPAFSIQELRVQLERLLGP